ncbi:MAG: ArsC/Spx/MgsR family protein [Clostridia bacterium]|nr:ArsC/Spx/MgsR family protein [Clostridia bacterium]
MNIIIYASKRDFNVQKAERWFKERGVKYAFMDIKKRPVGKREMELFYQKLGRAGLVNLQSKQYLESTARFLQTTGPFIEALMEKPELLNTPIVRNGNEVTSGYKPEVWVGWE